jgi:hypothetical protein
MSEAPSCSWCDKPAKLRGEDGTYSCGQGQGDGLEPHDNLNVVYMPLEKIQMDNEPMLQFFKYEHLPEHLAKVSQPFCEMAEGIVRGLPRNPERTVALRKLLESKDCAVRAVLYEEPSDR